MFCVRLYFKKLYKIILGHKTCKKTKNFPTENIFKKNPNVKQNGSAWMRAEKQRQLLLGFRKPHKDPHPDTRCCHSALKSIRGSGAHLHAWMLKVNTASGLEEHLNPTLRRQKPWPITYTPCVRRKGRNHLMAFWVNTDSQASWEPYVTFLASALLPALDLWPHRPWPNIQECLSFCDLSVELNAQKFYSCLTSPGMSLWGMWRW